MMQAGVRLRQNTETSLPELTEQHRFRQKEEELSGLESVRMAESETECAVPGLNTLEPECVTAHSGVHDVHVQTHALMIKTEPDLGSTHTGDLRMKSLVLTEHAYAVQIRTETDDGEYIQAEHASDLQDFKTDKMKWECRESLETKTTLPELTEQHRIRLKEEELSGLESVHMAESETECAAPGLNTLEPECVTAHSGVSDVHQTHTSLIKTGTDPGSNHTGVLIKKESLDLTKLECVPHLRPDQIKMETDDGEYLKPEHFRDLHNECVEKESDQMKCESSESSESDLMNPAMNGAAVDREDHTELWLCVGEPYQNCKKEEIHDQPIDCGNLHHHCGINDENNQTRMSRKRANGTNTREKMRQNLRHKGSASSVAAYQRHTEEDDARSQSQCISPVETMADNANVKKRKRGPLSEQTNAAKMESNKKGQTRVNLGMAFPRWRKLRDMKGFQTDVKLAFFLLDHYQRHNETSTPSKPTGAPPPPPSLSSIAAESDSESSEEVLSPSRPSRRHRGRGQGDAVTFSESSDEAPSTSGSRSPNPGWKTEADTDDAVRPPPKFIPKRTPGVQPPLNVGNPSPSETFSHFFDSEVLKLLCENTNKYAATNLEQGAKYSWTQITPEEMKRYIGMLLYTSMVTRPKLPDFWRVNTPFHVPLPATIMTRARFMAIAASVHMSDPTEDAENDKKKGTEDYDLLHRVKPLLGMMRSRCKAIYHPKQHIAVDERMVPTKARLFGKQYMKAKPTKWGLKFFVLADINGYTLDFNLYTGKSKFASGKSLFFDVVAGLVNKDYLGSGYVVYMDNFYTSPLLFRHLAQQGFGACGTYREGRVGVPTTEENALTKKSPRGSIRSIRDRDLLFVKWMDPREVSVCTNIHPVSSGDTVQRWQKTGDGKRQRIAIPRPIAVTEYSKYMGGVDTSDQLLGTNSVHRRTRRLPTTVFQHVVDIAVTNSYVIHKELCASSQRKCMTRQRFQEELCAQLLGVPLNSNPQRTPTHLHAPVPTSSGQVKAMVASLGRRRCKLCNRSTPWKCEDCDVGLCLALTRNCFREHLHALNV